MVICNYQGRLGNNLYQFFASYFFSKQHNLSLYLNNSDAFYNNGNLEIGNIINSYQSKYIHNNKSTIIIDDYNFFDFFESEKLPDSNFSFVGYFQFKKFILPRINEIKNILKIRYDDVDKNQVFLHYRLGDIQNSNLSLPIDYYVEALEKLGNPSGYISSDTIEHESCEFLIRNYNLKVYKGDPWSTINFGKNFNNLILSEGTFSSIIGLLSDASKIVTNCRDTKNWGNGDVFSGYNNTINLFYN